MTMLIAFIKDYNDINLGEFSAGATAYIPRPIARRLVSAGTAKPYASYLKDQKVKKETAELKPEPEKAVVKPVVEKVEIPEVEEVDEVDEREEFELEPDDCAGFKKDGDPCTATPKEGSLYCWRHEPK